ncbi:MAG: TIM barrel protein [Candidatus Latescibacteria bacterium]|nr:TIM barrel protein [Candidatus Latescibacterota bacterium]
MYVGSYDAPIQDLSSYRLRLEELALLGFRSVGLAIDWDDHPRDLPGDERRALADLVARHPLELRLHPDLGKLANQAQRHNADLMVWTRQQMEPLAEWALELGALSICCDSIRADLDQTVDVLRLCIEITRGTPLKFGVENSQRGIINSPARMNEAVDRIGDERMGLLVDVGHINTTIANGWIDCPSPAAFLAALQVPIWDTHIHNNNGRTDGHLTVRDSQGTLDMVAVVEGFRAQGYSGPLNMECARKEQGWTLGQMEGTLVADKAYLESLIGAAG